ncbi:hypothetical protein [Microbacterium sp. RU33B]|uniref:hypothetical protein n=1 Tax=Microbacterium sp. RU33B TaxID=1907390 RepID=UPI000976FF8E|nr:hypothetical protein [Microbacterium sp. RU33B]
MTKDTRNTPDQPAFVDPVSSAGADEKAAETLPLTPDAPTADAQGPGVAPQSSARRPFLQRTGVRIAGAAVGAVALLGVGVGVGVAATHAAVDSPAQRDSGFFSDDGDQDGFGRPDGGARGGDELRGHRPGPGGSLDHSDSDGDSDDDGDTDTDLLPSPGATP